ncbi:MAG: helix-turn-helix transcriptional regulator [Acetobacteraceae bacterium]|nr:helix-turn-helix transcriptional regulator [Acetobacteraceae bacterium]
MLRADPAAWARTAALMRAALEVAKKDPEVFEVEEARRALRASVLDVARELLMGTWDGAFPRTFRSSPARHRIVRLMEDYLRANPRRLVDTADLCATLGRSPSRLRSAFAATFGVGPQRYLRIRRLAMVRSALRSGDPRWSSAQEVALAHGFWHLERFTREYRDMFGESPSATFSRAAGQHGRMDSREDEVPAPLPRRVAERFDGMHPPTRRSERSRPRTASLLPSVLGADGAAFPRSGRTRHVQTWPRRCPFRPSCPGRAPAQARDVIH